MLLRIMTGLLLICLGLPTGPARAADRLRLATTTSTENSGLLGALIPAFEKAQGTKVHVISVGTGKALKLGQRCDVDLVMVHAPEMEKRFVAEGYGIERRPIMYNYFLLVGPAADPAGVRGAQGVAEAFRRIAAKGAPFVSRGDNSGTNVKERAIWRAAGVEPSWPGYKQAGQGMGAVLTMANQMQAYTLSDSGTFYKYLSVGKLELKALLRQDGLLKNPYAVIMVNPSRCPRVKAQQASAFIDYLVSPQGQGVIRDFKARGQQLFWPDAQAKP